MLNISKAANSSVCNQTQNVKTQHKVCYLSHKYKQKKKKKDQVIFPAETTLLFTYDFTTTKQWKVWQISIIFMTTNNWYMANCVRQNAGGIIPGLSSFR